MTTWQPTVNQDKYKQVILYLLNSGANNLYLGKVKLFKLLYYIDFDHYEEFHRSVTGDVYRKLLYGPVGEHADHILDQLRTDELISITTKPVGNVAQYVFTVSPDACQDFQFEQSELQIMDEVIARWKWHRTKDIVAATHGEAPWRAVEMGEEIPYTLAYDRHRLYGYATSEDEEVNDSFARS